MNAKKKKILRKLKKQSINRIAIAKGLAVINHGKISFLIAGEEIRVGSAVTINPADGKAYKAIIKKIE